MSLKDRLKTTQKAPSTKVKQQETQIQYYNTSEVANSVDSLGVLDTLLFDDDLNSIFVSGAKNIYVERNGKIHKSTQTFRDNVQLENLIKKNAQNIGIEVSPQNPCFEFSHEIGTKVVVTLPPLSNVPSLFIKVFKDKHANFQVLQEDLIISKEISLVLEALCAIKKNILIVGEKNSLKTTLLSAMAKKIPTNNKAIIIDTEQEIKIEKQNYTNYDFSKFQKNPMANNLLNSIINSSVDKIVLNSENKILQTKIVEKIKNGYRGLITTYCAKNAQEAIKELAENVLRQNLALDFESAKSMILSTFDVIIQTRKDDFGKRKIVSISQTNIASVTNPIKEIFTLDFDNEHRSTGLIPNFFDDIKNSSLPISENIFDESYKHTYHKNPDLEKFSQFAKKGANIDILKKFKKDLPTLNDETTENIEYEEGNLTEADFVEEHLVEESQVGEFKAEIIDNLNKVENPEDLMKRAQEKFNELKENAQMQFEMENSSLEEYENDSAEDENL